ncbi:putative mitochondrial protein [Andalucia godoyi]|uniref:Putative mitochondrial protein n=1 Tax=Andalucia godoyi TaxID=505711 RepID=A0A8K0AIQ5_ANDGO|nr:putative mitochondrial protein [Andalucia godoyi]|eukprot:ANDGO_00498.mRNA.1 putative mitochondrial protein
MKTRPERCFQRDAFHFSTVWRHVRIRHLVYETWAQHWTRYTRNDYYRILKSMIGTVARPRQRAAVDSQTSRHPAFLHQSVVRASSRRLAESRFSFDRCGPLTFLFVTSFISQLKFHSTLFSFYHPATSFFGAFCLLNRGGGGGGGDSSGGMDKSWLFRNDDIPSFSPSRLRDCIKQGDVCIVGMCTPELSMCKMLKYALGDLQRIARSSAAKPSFVMDSQPDERKTLAISVLYCDCTEHKEFCRSRTERVPWIEAFQALDDQPSKRVITAPLVGTSWHFWGFVTALEKHGFVLGRPPAPAPVPVSGNV